MSLVPPTSTRICVLITLLACALVLWTDYRRSERVVYVSKLVQAANDGAQPDGGRPRVERTLIVPERAEPAFHWLAQTDQMLARREWRVRRVDYDDAPFGREVFATSPYRWWLGLLGAVHRAATGQSVDRSAERAALMAGPLLHVGALLGFAALVAWRFGPLAASVVAIGLAAMFPFAAGFLPGVPDHHGLARLLALAGALSVLAGLHRPGFNARGLALGGVLGGLGMWVDVPTQVPFLLGIAAGALLVAWTRRAVPPANADAAPALVDDVRVGWRVWSAAGAATVLVAYLAEYAPAKLGSWHLATVHPLYGVAWLGLGELMVLASGWIQRGRRVGGGRAWISGLAALGAVASVPVAMRLLDSSAFLTTDVLSARLTSEPGALAAADLWDLLIHATDRLQMTALALPVVAVVPALWLIAVPEISPSARTGIAFALGVLAVTAGFACREIGMFAAMDVSLLVLAVAVATGAADRIGRSAKTKVLGYAVFALCALPGLLQVPPRFAGDQTVLTRSEAEELVERDLAQWLGRHTREPRPIVFAPPHVSTTLCYYGDLRGLGSFDPDNRSGFGAALTIAGAKTMEEVQAAIQARGIRYVIVPTWDPFFDEFARRYLASNLSNRVSLLVTELRKWNLPPWLTPVAYQMPAIPGFERESVGVFEVVDEQKAAPAAGRLLEYLLEIGRVEVAAAMADGMRRYPGDLGALAARAQVQRAREDSAGFAQTVAEMRTRIATGADRYLTFDRRLSVATVLAQGNELELARRQMRQCVAELDEQKLRSLSDGALYRLLVLCQAFELKVPEPWRNLAMNLLPAPLRKEL
jgi:hypothetical protein